MIQVPTKDFVDLEKTARNWQKRNELGYRFAVALRGALRRADKALTIYIDYARKTRPDDERILRRLKELREADVGTTLPPTAPRNSTPPPQSSRRR